MSSLQGGEAGLGGGGGGGLMVSCAEFQNIENKATPTEHISMK